jgi:hypothetical protein
VPPKTTVWPVLRDNSSQNLSRVGYTPTSSVASKLITVSRSRVCGPSPEAVGITSNEFDARQSHRKVDRFRQIIVRFMALTMSSLWFLAVTMMIGSWLGE